MAIVSSELDERLAFVREQTAVEPVPFVEEIRIHTATELTPIWRATNDKLGAYGIDAPFWCVPWAGGQGIARFVLDHPELVRGKRVLDFGAGSGLVGIACVLAGAKSVRAVDVDPLAEAACHLNAAVNGVALDIECRDIVGGAVDVDVLVAGDVWYDRIAAARFGPWLSSVATSGVRVITGDPGRAYVPADAIELARFEVPTCQDLEAAPMRTTRVLEIVARR